VKSKVVSLSASRIVGKCFGVTAWKVENLGKPGNSKRIGEFWGNLRNIKEKWGRYQSRYVCSFTLRWFWNIFRLQHLFNGM